MILLGVIGHQLRKKLTSFRFRDLLKINEAERDTRRHPPTPLPAKRMHYILYHLSTYLFIYLLYLSSIYVSVIYLPSSDYLDVFICMHIYVMHSNEWDSVPKIGWMDPLEPVGGISLHRVGKAEDSPTFASRK